MARPQKKGLDYFPFDVGFFSNNAIVTLRAHHGNDGVLLYMYLLCKIYEKGYYINLDEDAFSVAYRDLGMNINEIGLCINFLCKRSLFDDTLFTSDKVLTSRGIQLRYQEAVKVRGSKNAIEVEKKYWILNENETQCYICCTDSSSYSEKNPSYSEKNPSYSLEKPPKVKYSKVKYSKVKKSTPNGYLSILDELVEDTDLKELYIKYLKTREEINSPLTDNGLRILIDDVIKLEPTDIDRQKEILKKAIKGNWKDVYPLKTEKGQNINDYDVYIDTLDHDELGALTRKNYD